MPLMKRDNGVWYADFRRRGGGLLSCRTKDKVAAEREYARLLVALEEGEKLTGRKAGCTLKDAFDKADALVFRRKKSYRTFTFHRVAITRAIPSETLLHDIGIDHAQALIVALEQKGNQPATVNRTLQTFKRVLGLAVEWRMLDAAPKFPTIPEPKGRTRVVEADEEQRIVDEFRRMGRPEMADLTVFLVDTGLRLGELMKRDCLHHDAEQHTVELWDTKDPSGRGGARTVPLTERADAALRRWLAAPALTKDQIESRWQTMRRNIGGNKTLVIHALRHTCATRLWRSQKFAAAQVMAWMGHKDIKTTLRYTHLTVKDLIAGRDALQADRPMQQRAQLRQVA